MSLVSIVSQTPGWVWLVLAGLIWLGLRRMRDREVSLGGLVLFPLVLIGLSLYGVAGSGLSPATLAGLGIGGLLGLAAGISLERRYAPMALGNGRLRLRGEWTSLAIVLVVFLSHYVQTVLGLVAPGVAASEMVRLAAAGLSGFLAMMLLTRTISRLRIALAPMTA